MASVSIILKNIDEKFCQCCICFEQYEDPRQLACLHRYCKHCLEQLIGRSRGKINCPLCQAEYNIPENGAEGFKKDFYMNEILEFIQVQNSLEEDQSRKCVGCSQQEKSTAYCFKCRDFLCRNCHTYHATSKVLEEHRPHILTLKDVDSQNISIEKLSSLKEAPRCQTHPENMSQLCCKTCANRPICVTCTYGEHRNHDIFDVISFANAERKKLKQQLDELNNCKDKFYQKSHKIEKAKQNTISDAETKLKDVKIKYQQEVEKINIEQKKIEDEGLRTETEIKNRLKANSLLRKQEMEEKLNKIRDEFKTLEVKDKLEAEAKLKEVQENQSVKEFNLKAKQEKIDTKWKDFSESLEAEKNKKLKRSSEISDQIQSTIKRCENITQTGSGVLSSDNNWTIAQNVGDIFTATESLINDMKKEFSGIETLSDSLTTNLSFRGFTKVENVKISDQVEKVIEVEGIQAKGWRISGIACTKNGSIVLTGPTNGFQYHVTVINHSGKVVNQFFVKCLPGHFNYPESYCDAFDQFKVVIACDPDWVGILDVRDGSKIGINMGHILDWPLGQSLRSVCFDEERNQIIVGCGHTNNIYFLNDQLGHVSTLNLLNVNSLTDVFLINGHLMVCDNGGMKILVVNMDNTIVRTMYSPVLTSKHPVCVRRDGYGFIYIIWSNVMAGLGGTYVMTQYNSDMQLLRTKSIYTSVRCFTVSQLNSTGKLLMASYTNGKIHQYGLRPDREEDN